MKNQLRFDSVKNAENFKFQKIEVPKKFQILTSILTFLWSRWIWTVENGENERSQKVGHLKKTVQKWTARNNLKWMVLGRFGTISENWLFFVAFEFRKARTASVTAGLVLNDLVRGRQNFGTRQNGFLINDFFDFLKSETLKKKSRVGNFWRWGGSA